MTTWAFESPVHHPWYDKPSRKRKHSLREASNDTPKRRRCDSLEFGFAHLALSNPQVETQPSNPSIIIAPFELSAMDTDIDLPSPCVIHPSSVQEPPPIPEVKMKNSSWYEPEKDRELPIIVTLLEFG